MRRHRKKRAMHDLVTKLASLSTEQDVRKRLICNLPVSLLYQNRWRNQSRKGAGYYQTKILKKGARKYLKKYISGIT